MPSRYPSWNSKEWSVQFEGLWNSLWVSAVASGLLWGAYRAVEWRWPERYIGMTQTFGLTSQETLLRFASFRLVPTLIVAATTFVTVDRLHGYIWIAAGVIWLLSVGLTHGRVVVKNVVSRNGEANHTGYHLWMASVLTAAVVVSGLIWPLWAPVVPSPKELLNALWSGVLTAALGGTLYLLLKERPASAPADGPHYLADRAVRDVGVEAFDWAYRSAMLAGGNPILLRAILIAESAQRPRWFRQIENVGVWLGPAKTSGVMQMPSKRPLSDLDSIQAAALRYAGKWQLRQEGLGSGWRWSIDWGEEWAVLTKQNPDLSYFDSVTDVGRMLLEFGNSFGQPDPALGLVFESRRYAGRIALRGLTPARSVTLRAYVDAEAIDISTAARPESAASGSWWSWEIDFDPRTTVVELSVNEGAPVRRLEFWKGLVHRMDPMAAAWNQGEGEPTYYPDGGGAVYNADGGGAAYNADGEEPPYYPDAGGAAYYPDGGEPPYYPDAGGAAYNADGGEPPYYPDARG